MMILTSISTKQNSRVYLKINKDTGIEISLAFENGKIITGGYLLSIYPMFEDGGLYRYQAINYDNILCDIDIDSEEKLKIIGVDEL